MRGTYEVLVSIEVFKMEEKIKGKYICLVCNKVFDSVGESVLHNYGDHTTGMDKEEFENLNSANAKTNKD